MHQHYPVEEAMKAQAALRAAAGLEPERFPLAAVIGMLSDEIESLRRLGRSDDGIADLIRSSSAIDITAAEIAAHYAPPEQRHPPDR